MGSDWLIGLELFLIFGLVLVFGGWQLWSLRRDKGSSRDREREPED